MTITYSNKYYYCNSKFDKDSRKFFHSEVNGFNICMNKRIEYICSYCNRNKKCFYPYMNVMFAFMPF